MIAIFRKNGTRLVPTQNYQNMQRWTRTAYWSARTAQLAGVKEYYLSFDSTDPDKPCYYHYRDHYRTDRPLDDHTT